VTRTDDAGRAGRRAVDARRATYRREVTGDHVGQRVSIRFLVDGDEGPRPTDRVGRLLSTRTTAGSSSTVPGPST
jgi:hypothetical protein